MDPADDLSFAYPITKSKRIKLIHWRAMVFGLLIGVGIVVALDVILMCSNGFLTTAGASK